MTLRGKILLTILLAVAFSWLTGCAGEHYVYVPAPSGGLTDAAFLRRTYDIYNDAYFQNKLTSAITVNLLEPDSTGNMASTFCDTDGSCVIQFNLKYTLAPRIGKQTLLHEQCHVKTWMQDMDAQGEQIEHGKNWRACMLNLDMQGAFREILIDGYAETMP
jgi:SprT-like family